MALELDTVLKCTLLDFCLQWSVYCVSVIIKNERFFDLTGSFSFLVLAYLSYEWSGVWSPRQTIQTGMVCTWALRLGLFLFTRILKEGRDRRFNHIRNNPLRFFIAWTLQGIWVIVTILPTLLVNTDSKDVPIGTRDYIGWMLWTLGFAIEVIADFQKAVFRNNPQNKGRFIDQGLWRWSRHPNYCGEILLWFGLYISASSVLRGYQYLVILCPVFNYLLITKWSGIPPLEKHAAQKWANSNEYREYLRKTPVLFPHPA